METKPIRGTRLDIAHPLSRGMVGCWLFNEGTGGKVFDLSLNHYEGNIEAGVDWIPEGVHFDAGEAVSFSDKDAFALSKYTWMIMLESDTVPDGSQIEQPLWNADTQFQFNWNHSDASCLGSAAHKSGASWYAAQLTTSLLANTKYIIMATYNGIQIEIFLNGISEDIEICGVPNASVGDLCVGNPNFGGNENFVGGVYLFYLWNYALMSSQVAYISRNPDAMFLYI